MTLQRKKSSLGPSICEVFPKFFESFLALAGGGAFRRRFFAVKIEGGELRSLRETRRGQAWVCA